MFDVKRSVGKTIEIKIEEGEDNDGNDGIYEQVIVATIGSVTIANALTVLQFLCPIQILGHYIVGTQESAYVYKEKLTIGIDINRSGKQYVSGVNGTIIAIY